MGLYVTYKKDPWISLLCHIPESLSPLCPWPYVHAEVCGFCQLIISMISVWTKSRFIFLIHDLLIFHVIQSIWHSGTASHTVISNISALHAQLNNLLLLLPSTAQHEK